MIEYEGWIVDFDNMDCLSPRGETRHIMLLGELMYITDSWVYPYPSAWGKPYERWAYFGVGQKDSKRLYELYIQYQFEKEFFDI